MDAAECWKPCEGWNRHDRRDCFSRSSDRNRLSKPFRNSSKGKTASNPQRAGKMPCAFRSTNFGRSMQRLSARNGTNFSSSEFKARAFFAKQPWGFDQMRHWLPALPAIYVLSEALDSVFRWLLNMVGAAGLIYLRDVGLVLP